MARANEQYQLTFEERPGYLYANVTATNITTELARSYLAEVAARCRESHHTRLILKRDIPAMLETGDLFFTSGYFSTIMLGITVAFVNPHANVKNDFDFAITVSQNRGALFSVHATVTDAEQWLLSR
jgi:hypothetical protein